MNNVQIYFVIVAYKPDVRVLRDLIAVLRPNRCILVDNGGVNRIGMSGIEVIHNQKNLGYGPGANVGIRRANEKRYSWIVIVNQDIHVTKRAVDEFISKLDHIPAGIAGPVMGTLDSKRWSTILGDKKQGDHYVSGSWFAINREVIEKSGMFYESYFLYYEEVDLCMRANQDGFPLTQLSLSGYRHNETSSLGKGSPIHQYYLARNHLMFVERCAPLKVKLYELLRLPKTIWEHILKKENGALRGVKDYLLRRFGELKELL